MDQVEAVAHAQSIELGQSREQLRRGEAELAGVAPAFLPLARARRRQLDADAQVGAHVEPLGGLCDEVYLVELLHHDEDSLAHLLGQQGQLDVAVVLVAIAHDEGVALALHGDDGMELGLGAGLQSQVELAAVADDFLHHRLHLVHFDGVDDEVLPLVAVFLLGLLEAAGRLLDAVVQDVGKPQQDGGGDVAQCEFVHHVAQVYLRVVLTRSDKHIPLLIDTKIRGAPAVDVVELLRILDGPFLHFFSVIDADRLSKIN